jgi:ABC-2 type transport system permease protein
VAHADAKHHLARHFDVSLFHRIRRGNRLAHQGDRRYQLRCLHRAGFGHVVAAYAEHFERVVRHLLSEVQGTIFELLSAPVSHFELVLGFVGAAATKSIVLGLIIMATAALFVPLRVEHPAWMLLFLVLTSCTFSLFGFIIGIWADGFEKLQVTPLLIITPLTFLGGSFYSIHILPPFWQTVALFNPVVYLISGFRWSFYGSTDVHVGVSLGVTALFLAAFMAIVAWIFKTGYRLKP